MTEETVTVGDQEVRIEETEDGFVAESVEDEDDFEEHLREEHNVDKIIGSFDRIREADGPEETAFSDAELVLCSDGHVSKSSMQDLEDDERVRFAWVDQHNGELQVGVVDREGYSAYL